MTLTTSFLSEAELAKMGFAYLGQGVCVSRHATFYRPENISIGSHSRIDDFCVVAAGTGGIRLGAHVHIAVYVSLIGAGTIEVGDFSGISARVSVYSSNDDYSGHTMTGPTVEERYRNVTHAPVSLGRHVIVGAGSVLLPGIILGDGVAVGALSLVNRSCEPFGVYVGVPAKRVRERSRELLKVEQRRLEDRRRAGRER